MKTIIKDWNGSVKLYHEAYDNYLEFYETLIKRQDGANQTLDYIMRDHDSSWVGVKSVDEAKGLFLNGWESPLEQLKCQIDNELRTLENKRVTKTYSNVCGFVPIIPNAIRGLPNSMMDVRTQKTKSRVLRFCLSIDRSCGTRTDEIVKKMSKQLAYIAMLERSGMYRCRIEVFFTAFGGLDRNGRKYSTSCSVLVKSENQLFDTKRLCYPVVNPSMLRLLMFGWEESLPLKHDDYIVGGYGTSYEHWDEKSQKTYVNAINENGENIIFMHLNSDIDDVMRKGGVK